MAGLLVAGLTFLAVFWAPSAGQAYGITLFCVAPLGIGFASAMFVSTKSRLTYKQCAASAGWSLLFVTVGILVFAFEGIICLLMAAPMVVPLIFVGAWAGYGIRMATRNARDQKLSAVALFAFVPLLMSREAMGPPRLVEHVESTTMVIDAPPEKVWPYVCSLRGLPAPTEPLFRAGIGHPVDIETIEPRLGRRRVCRLSTGDMPETIEAFEPNHRLTFRVLSTPASMKETGLYGEIQTRHLNGYYICRKGDFRLEALSGGRTRLIGTSWYANRIAPDPYWVLWTDSVVEEVHLRVMNEIKRRAERDVLNR